MEPKNLDVDWPAQQLVDAAEAAEEELWRRNHPEPRPAHDGAVGGPGAEELWECQTYRRLNEHFDGRIGAGSRLLSLGTFADTLQRQFGDEVAHAGYVCDTPLLCPRPTRKRGLLNYFQLNWLDSAYFSVQKRRGDETGTNVLTFRPPDLEKSEPWREFLLATAETDAAPFDDLAAIYDVLGMLAQRRTSMLAVGAQRRLCKIALPWARCRFVRHDGQRTREYLLVPVLTLLSRRVTAEFRRTVTLTLFLLPREADGDPPLDATDLAALCHQSIWLNQRPPLPMLYGTGGVGGQYLEGPLRSLISRFLATHERHLPGIFDAIMRSAILALGVGPASRNQAQSVRMLVAISRARSAVFGSALHADDVSDSSVWATLRSLPPAELAQHVGKLLSFNAAREGREWLVNGEGFRLDKMRVTNPYEEDTNTIAFYNPMSRFLANVMPRSREEFPTSLKMGIAWLNLLAGAISLIKEIIRAYRYEVEQHRNRIEALRLSNDRAQVAAELRKVHETTLAILEEIDVVYSFELVGQSYKAAHARVLEMDGVSQERENLLKELEITTALLRSEESDKLTSEIADSTKNTDTLTKVVLAFTAVLIVTAVKDLDEVYHIEPFAHNWLFFATLALMVGLLIGVIVFSFRKKK